MLVVPGIRFIMWKRGGYEMRSIKTFGPTVIHLIKMRLCFRITCERARSQWSRFRALKTRLFRERARSRVPLECLLNTSLPRRLYTLHVVSILSKNLLLGGGQLLRAAPPSLPLGLLRARCRLSPAKLARATGLYRKIRHTTKRFSLN